MSCSINCYLGSVFYSCRIDMSDVNDIAKLGQSLSILEFNGARGSKFDKPIKPKSSIVVYKNKVFGHVLLPK